MYILRFYFVGHNYTSFLVPKRCCQLRRVSCTFWAALARLSRFKHFLFLCLAKYFLIAVTNTLSKMQMYKGQMKVWKIV